MRIVAKLVKLARQAAGAEGLETTLMCVVVVQEANWNPWAIRYEPLLFAKFVAPLSTNNKVRATEAYRRGMFWGLMQGMRKSVRGKSSRRRS
jgi:hypothetical protein